MSRFEFGEYDDGEPYVIFPTDGEDLIANYDNSVLYTHGKTPHIDHFFIEFDKDDERVRNFGAFVWRYALADFDELANNLIENDFTHVHKAYPSEYDVQAYEGNIEKAQEAIVKIEMDRLDQELEHLLGEE
jgi:hypothetical protein